MLRGIRTGRLNRYLCERAESGGEIRIRGRTSKPVDKYESNQSQMWVRSANSPPIRIVSLISIDGVPESIASSELQPLTATTLAAIGDSHHKFQRTE